MRYLKIMVANLQLISLEDLLLNNKPKFFIFSL